MDLKRRRTAAAFGVLGATAGFVAIVAWLHVVRPDIDPIAHGVSRYAAGDHGYAVTGAFALLSGATFVAAYLVGSSKPGTRTDFPRRTLEIAAAGMFLVVLFPMRSPAPARFEYLMHQSGGAVFFLAAAIGVQALGGRLRAASASARLQVTARVAGVVAVASLVAFLGSIASVLPLHPVLGLLQRTCLAAICVALVTFALGVARGSS